ncbi:uncharacterized protein L3040_000754 [Drepanopeziza brunnea f. sp. 'multigermtubi']|uniref:uncharacterized protein n=1 Tax=Drepanopeziza brunnea f. sp. 'multigermtubi' TaxID=698441 RepID=UPI00239D4EA6|nr:hypothetical protein L3040_000754 [Drepanopeziza brunnea f. sp. 'multigermtubi']
MANTLSYLAVSKNPRSDHTTRMEPASHSLPRNLGEAALFRDCYNDAGRTYDSSRQRNQTPENGKRTTARPLMRALHRSVDKGERAALALDRARSASNGKGATATQDRGPQPSRQRASARSTVSRDPIDPLGHRGGMPLTTIKEVDLHEDDTEKVDHRDFSVFRNLCSRQSETGAESSRHQQRSSEIVAR